MNPENGRARCRARVGVCVHRVRLIPSGFTLLPIMSFAPHPRTCGLKGGCRQSCPIYRPAWQLHHSEFSTGLQNHLQNQRAFYKPQGINREFSKPTRKL